MESKWHCWLLIYMIKLAQMVLKEQSSLKGPSSYQEMSNSLSLTLKCIIYLNVYFLQVSVNCVIGMSKFTFYN